VPFNSKCPWLSVPRASCAAPGEEAAGLPSRAATGGRRFSNEVGVEPESLPPPRLNDRQAYHRHNRNVTSIDAVIVMLLGANEVFTAAGANNTISFMPR
jgi:hypothetical protein